MSSKRDNNGTFRDLALALTDEERRELLKKISRSLSLRMTDDQPLFSHEVPDHALHGRIVEEIDGLSFWRRLRFTLRRVFSSKSPDQAYIDFRLAEFRRRVKSVNPAMAPMEHHSIAPGLAAATWKVYKAAYPLIPMFLDLWRSGKYLQESIEYLLGQRIPAARRNLIDFATVEELQDAFMENELKSDVRKLVVERMGLYLDDIPDDLFVHLEEGVLPLYHLRALCLFDFNRFFEVFGFDPGVSPPEESPPFKACPTSAALTFVERLFHGIHSALRLEKGFYVHLDLLDSYLEMKDAEESAEKSAGPRESQSNPLSLEPESSHGDETEYQERRERVQALKESLGKLHQAAVGLSATIAFPELVRFYRKDPWYKIAAYLPKLSLREFHQSYLTMRVLGQLDESFAEVRVGVVARMSKELFGEDPLSFEYFRLALVSAPDHLGLPEFRHVRSATALHNFLQRVYRARIQETVRILSRVLPVRQRDSSSALVINVAGIEQTMADLVGFDKSFAPDSDDGKSFFRVRYGVEKDATLHRSYRNIVQQKDREVRAIIDTGREHLRGLVTLFGNLQRTMSDQLRQRYAEVDPRVSAIDGLDNLLEEFSQKIEQNERLMKQILAMEEGY